MVREEMRRAYILDTTDTSFVIETKPDEVSVQTHEIGRFFDMSILRWEALDAWLNQNKLEKTVYFDGREYKLELFKREDTQLITLKATLHEEDIQTKPKLAFNLLYEVLTRAEFYLSDELRKIFSASLPPSNGDGELRIDTDIIAELWQVYKDEPMCHTAGPEEWLESYEPPEDFVEFVKNPGVSGKYHEDFDEEVFAWFHLIAAAALRRAELPDTVRFTVLWDYPIAEDAIVLLYDAQSRQLFTLNDHELGIPIAELCDAPFTASDLAEIVAGLANSFRACYERTSWAWR